MRDVNVDLLIPYQWGDDDSLQQPFSSFFRLFGHRLSGLLFTHRLNGYLVVCLSHHNLYPPSSSFSIRNRLFSATISFRIPSLYRKGTVK